MGMGPWGRDGKQTLNVSPNTRNMAAMSAWSWGVFLGPTGLSEPILAPNLGWEPRRQQELIALFQGQALPDLNRTAKPWVTAPPAELGPLLPPYRTHSWTMQTR